MKNVVNIAEHSKDNRQWTPEQMIKSALEIYEKDFEEKPKAALLILCDEKEKDCHIMKYWFTSNLSNQEEVFFCSMIINILVK